MTMRPMNISDVFAFNKVASTLSFTRAARQIGLSRSAVSKKISRLEENLGVVLMNRSTRSVSLTEAGRVFYQRTFDLDTTIERAAEFVREGNLHPSGTVRFALPSTLGAALLPALISRFQSAWPDVRLDIHYEDRQVNLIDGGFDLAIQIAQNLHDSCLISRRLAATHKVLAASPGYLDKYGVPTNIAELKGHSCLCHGVAVPGGSNWRLQMQDNVVDVPCVSSLSASNSRALVQAACLDSGIVYMPEICICDELRQQHLQIILPEASDPQPCGVYAVYPHRNAAATVKVLVDFIEQELAQF